MSLRTQASFPQQPGYSPNHRQPSTLFQPSLEPQVETEPPSPAPGELSPGAQSPDEENVKGCVPVLTAACLAISLELLALRAHAVVGAIRAHTLELTAMIHPIAEVGGWKTRRGHGVIPIWGGLGQLFPGDWAGRKGTCCTHRHQDLPLQDLPSGWSVKPLRQRQ